MFRTAAFVSLLLPPLAAQTPIVEISPTSSNHLGWILHDVGDIDGDGARDFSASYAGSFAHDENFSEVNAYSGATRKFLGQVRVARVRFRESSFLADGCGESLVVLRNDGGEFEVAIGAPGSGREGRNTGAVETFTKFAHDGPRLRWTGDEGADEFGAALAKVPDQDGDGRADLAIGAPGASEGKIRIVSTADGSSLDGHRPDSSGGRFGVALAATKDVGAVPLNGLAVGHPGCTVVPSAAGAVHLYARKSDQAFRTIAGHEPGEQFGARIVSDDLDGDERPELVIGSLGTAGLAAARVSVVRNGSDQRMWSTALPGPTEEAGLRIATCGDLDGDRVREVLVAFAPAATDVRPQFLVLSGADGHVVHAMKSVATDIDISSGAPKRRFLASETGLPLGRRLSALDAGDLDGDNVSDIWLAMRAAPETNAMRGTIALFSGAELGAKEKPSEPEPTPWVRVGSDPARITAIADDVRITNITELETHWTLRLSDELNAESRGGTCIETAFGKQISVLGDLNGDGRDDVWISGVAHDWDDYYGFVVSGATKATYKRFHNGDFANAVNIGDMNGDGVADLAIAASERTFRFCEMIGMAMLVDGESMRQLHGVKDRGGAYEFAATMVAIDDVDADGIRDLAVATPATPGWGYPEPDKSSIVCKVDLVACGKERGTVRRTLTGDASGVDGFGRALAFGGDWDGDGHGDLAIGAPLAQSHGVVCGAVHVYSGANWTRIMLFAGDIEDEGFGRELVWAPDLDGDGRAELVVAAPWAPPDRTGRVVVLSSKSKGVLYEVRGQRSAGAFGASIAIGDFELDGEFELVVGSPGTWRESGIEPGRVSLFALRDGRERARILSSAAELGNWMEDVQWTSRIGPYSYGETTLPMFGRALAVARDLDGVAGNDLLIGAPTYVGPNDGGAVYALGSVAVRALLTEK